jgi:hypothetical protein
MRLIFAALIALQPATSFAAWTLVIRDARSGIYGEALAMVVVPARYATKPACVAAGTAAKNGGLPASSFSSIAFTCVPVP